ncbi:hypothetical protein ACFYYR_29555 [Streptomyces sp. NPDC001922]|uniref:hypothetical protein n=1 Tax=Streptomyces sp. NPDC001922 TaxID=3364624 RepID=UPI0036C60034
MSTQTTARTSRSLRLAAVIAVPVMLFSSACGGGGEKDIRNEGVASAGDAPAGSDSGSDSGSGSGKAGSGGKAGKSAFYDAQLKYTQCMRKEGMTEWPDPKLSGYADWPRIEKIQEDASKQDGQKKYQAAAKDCADPMRKAMELEPKVDKQKVYESMLAHAQCMRSHGVSKFANPKMNSAGNVEGGGDPNPVSPEIDQDSPSYQRARTACESKLIDAAAGQQ